MEGFACRSCPQPFQLVRLEVPESPTAPVEAVARIGQRDSEEVSVEGPVRRFCPQPFRRVWLGVPEPPAALEGAVARSDQPVALLPALGLPPTAESY